MPSSQVGATGGSPGGRFLIVSARTASAARALPRSLAAALALVAALGAAPLLGDPAPAAAGDDSFWITIGEDVFARAAVKLAPLPGLGGGVVLERFDEHDGVVLTRLSRSAIDALSAIVHEEFRRCGGFVKHESLEEALIEMERLRTPRSELGTLPFSIDQPAMVNALASQVAQGNILSTITSLSTGFVNRYHAHPVGTQSATWIKNQWTGYAAGRPDVTVSFYSHGAITPQPSVVLTIPGSALPDEYVILGAHQDSIRSGCSISSNPGCNAPGADDDASGVAVLSEAIRIALANGFQPQRTVQFMAYAAEEVGLDGSTDIAQDYLDAGTNVVAVFQQDMTAYEGSVNDIYLITDWTNGDLNTFVADLIDTYQPGLLRGTTACGYGCSDHASWHNRGFRATFPFEATFNGSNPQIHTANDTVANFGNTAAHAAKFAKLAVAFMVEAGVDSAGTLQFSGGSFSVGEAGGNAAVTVTRTGGTVGPASVHCRTVAGGTATAGVDFTATDATLNWTAGQGGSKTCSIPILNDTVEEGSETVALALEDPTGAAAGSQVTATLTITDNDEGGVLQFAAATSQQGEGAGTATVTVNRTGGSASGVTVAYAVTGGTATGGGVDYTLAAGVLSFGSGVANRTFDVTLVDDAIVDPGETVQIQLSSAAGGATLGATTLHTLTILDNELDPLIFADGFETGNTSRWSMTLP